MIKGDDHLIRSHSLRVWRERERESESPDGASVCANGTRTDCSHYRTIGGNAMFTLVTCNIKDEGRSPIFILHLHLQLILFILHKKGVSTFAYLHILYFIFLKSSLR